MAERRTCATDRVLLLSICFIILVVFRIRAQTLHQCLATMSNVDIEMDIA